MKSNIHEVNSIQYKPSYSGNNFIHRIYIGLDRIFNKVQLDCCERSTNETWVFTYSSCPYKDVGKCLYSGLEYPYPLNKYGGTEIYLKEWK